jgi:hypothetical protein
MTRTQQGYGSATKAVVEVLNNLGYTNEPNTSKLPNGWRQKVETALARMNLKVHETTIYQTRIREVERKQKERDAAAAAVPVKVAPPTPTGFSPLPKPTPATPPDLTDLEVKLDDVIAIANFSKQYGGMKQLGKMISFIANHPIAELLKV